MSPRERTVILRDPIDPGLAWPLTGSADDEGILGALEKSGWMFEVRLVKTLSSLLRPDSVVLDVGANIGPITLPLAARCPLGVIHAFEPVTSTRSFLERNTAGIPNVKVHPVGLGASTGPRTIHVNPRHPGGAHTGGEAGEGEVSETVEVMTLDDWVEANRIERINMIKLDIEGDELAFLAGASRSLRRFRPVLAVECNPVALWRFAGVGPEALIDRLTGLYGDIGWVEEDGTIQRLTGIDQALFELSHHALIDLICGAPFPEALRSAESQDGEPFSRIPECAFVHSPSYRASFERQSLQASPGSSLRLPVRLHNTSRFWFGSRGPNPVNAAYRWRRGGRVVVSDGVRTPLPEPIAPGGAATIDLAVEVPATPGEYELVFSLVQEGYAWFDQLRPELGVVLPVLVRP